LTDWHWDIKRSLGETDLPNSFIKYLLDQSFNAEIDPLVVDTGTGAVFGLIVVITFYLQFRKASNQRSSTNS